MKFKIQMVVALMKMLDRKYEKGATVPAGTTQITDIPYAPDNSHSHKMDIIKPAGAEKPLPVIVNIHGGGWVYGDKDSYYRYYCMNLAKCGFAVVSMNYRLATAVAYPGQIEDIFQLLTYLDEHGSEYGLDISRVFLVGDSAGANMAGITGIIFKNDAVRTQYLPYPVIAGYFKQERKLTIRALGLCCGVYNFDTFMGEDIEFACREEILECVFGQENFKAHPLYEYTNVPKYLTKDYIPMFVMGSRSDHLYPETEKLIAAAESLGICMKTQLWEAEENLPHVFHLKENSPHEADVRREMLEFFTKQF